MQSWCTDLPAIQTGMLVVPAVTFHSTGSEVRPRPAAAAAAASLCLHREPYSPSYCYLQRWPFQTEEVEALPLIAATGTWTLSWFAMEKLCRFVFPDPGCALFSTVDEQILNVLSVKLHPNTPEPRGARSWEHFQIWSTLRFRLVCLVFLDMLSQC